MNSGGLLASAADLFDILSVQNVDRYDSAQGLFTKLYLDEELRSLYKMILDHKSNFFQSITGRAGTIRAIRVVVVVVIFVISLAIQQPIS